MTVIAFEKPAETLQDCTRSNTHPFTFDPSTRLAKVLSVYDGDTITIALEQINNNNTSSTPPKFASYHMRLYGVDAPELKSKDPEIKKKAIAARDFVKEQVEGKIVTVDIFNNRHISIPEDCDQSRFVTEKYGRLIGNVYYCDPDYSQPRDLAKELLARGFAKPYDGGKKQMW